MLTIFVHEEDNGRRWRAELNGETIYRGKSPHFGAARALIAAGHDPMAEARTFTSTGTLVFSERLRNLSRWSVTEPDHGRQAPTLRPYKPRPEFSAAGDQETASQWPCAHEFENAGTD